MTVQVFSDGVDDNVGTEEQRLLVYGGHESVIHDDANGGIGGFDALTGGLDVGDAEGRISGCLDPNQFSFGSDSLNHISNFVHIDHGDGVAASLRSHLVQEAIGAAVDVVDGDNVAAGTEGVNDGGCSC